MSFFFVAVYESIYMYHENKKNLLVQEKMQDISDYDLKVLVYQVVQGTELDDGTWIIQPEQPRQQEVNMIP